MEPCRWELSRRLFLYKCAIVERFEPELCYHFTSITANIGPDSMQEVPQALEKSNDLQKLCQYFKIVYMQSRSITQHRLLGVLKTINHSYKLQGHLDVYYSTKRILELDATQKCKRQLMTDIDMELFLTLVPWLCPL